MPSLVGSCSFARLAFSPLGAMSPDVPLARRAEIRNPLFTTPAIRPEPILRPRNARYTNSPLHVSRHSPPPDLTALTCPILSDGGEASRPRASRTQEGPGGPRSWSASASCANANQVKLAGVLKVASSKNRGEDGRVDDFDGLRRQQESP